MLDLAVKNPETLSEDGFTFNIVLPDGSESDATMTVRGADSAVVKQFARKLFKQQQAEEARMKRLKREKEFSLEEAEDLAIEVAALRVIGWSGLAEDGEELKFSKEEAVRVLTKYSWLREQVMEQSNNVVNFFR